MRFEDLSPEDQALVNTDFGGLDKVAAEQVKVASEMYNAGTEMAEATADQMDKLAAEKEEEAEEDEDMGESEKKASADYGNIIAEGFIDKLAELGEERYGNPAHYVMPYVEEKVAQVGAQAALEKFAGVKDSFMAGLSKAKGMASSAGGKAKGLAGKAGDKAKGAGGAVRDFGKATVQDSKDMFGKGLSASERLKKAKRPAMVAAGLAAGGAGAYYATKKND